MKKKVFGRRLKRDRNERKALFRSLVTSLVLQGKIETTEEKAKAIKADVDKMITMAKKGGNSISTYIFPNALQKFTEEVLPALDKRSSGYTRIIRAGKRLSDNASMAIMEWVDLDLIKPAVKKEKAPKKKKVVRATKLKTKKKESKNVKK